MTFTNRSLEIMESRAFFSHFGLFEHEKRAKGNVKAARSQTRCIQSEVLGM